MDNNSDFIDALLEEGIAPADQAIAKLDDQITNLAEILLECFDYIQTRQRARLGLIRKLQTILKQKITLP